MPAVQETVERVRSIDVDQYKYGFVTEVEMDKAPKGLSEDIVRFISAKKGEPAWMLEWRLDAYRRWRTMQEPAWARVSYDAIDYDDIYYYAAPKMNAAPKSLDEVDPEILRHLREARHPLARARDPGRRRAAEPGRRRRRVRLRSPSRRPSRRSCPRPA